MAALEGAQVSAQAFGSSIRAESGCPTSRYRDVGKHEPHAGITHAKPGRFLANGMSWLAETSTEKD
jgi:hypothetical protein